MPESGSSSGNGLCAPRCPRRMSPSFGGTFGSQQGDVLSALAAGLAADAAQTGRKALKVIRARSPELVRLSEKTGDDLISTSADYIDILLTSLRSDVEVPWSDREQQTREFGRLKAAQGVPLEALIDLLAVYRRATIELISQPIEDATQRDEIVPLAEHRLEDVVERLTTCVVRGYLEHLDAEHRTRENELYGLSAVVTSVGRSLDVGETSEVALDRARQFSSEARTDHLTGLANRREFERIMEREVALAERHNRKLSLMLIDLDNLKRINDRQGHRAGDVALRLVAQQLQRVVRTSDICARIGGDEFGVAMPETELERARDVAARLQAAVGEAGLAARSADRVAVSIGLGAWRPGHDWQGVYEAADSDLYEDKRRHKEARLLAGQPRPTPSLRVLGRASGRRRVAGS